MYFTSILYYADFFYLVSCILRNFFNSILYFAEYFYLNLVFCGIFLPQSCILRIFLTKCLKMKMFRNEKFRYMQYFISTVLLNHKKTVSSFAVYKTYFVSFRNMQYIIYSAKYKLFLTNFRKIQDKEVPQNTGSR